MPPTLYLIDGHALAYRVYFALNPSSATDNRWQTSTGEPTAGVYGFASVLLRIFEQDRPDYLAVAFDTGKTFRDEIFAEYKGTRAKMPDDLRTQMERIRELVDAFNIPRLELEGFEADDILGTIARQAEAKGLGVKIITGDKDLLQLVTERVIVNLAGSRLAEAKDYTPKDVEEFLGIRPDQVVDYKALVGDKSDNIPGVAGVGEKTAVSLLQTYGTLDEVYGHLENLAAGVRAKLEKDKGSAYQSQTLAKIVTDAPIELELNRAKTHDFDASKVIELFRMLEFRALMSRLTNLKPKGDTASGAQTGQQMALFGSPVEVVGTHHPQPHQTLIIHTTSELDQLIHKCSNASRIAFDTETTSTDPMRANLVGISIAVDEEEGAYIPVGHQNSGVGQLPWMQVREALRYSFTAPHIPKMGHNLKYDALVLQRHGLSVAPLWFDTMVAEWLTNPASRNLGLKNLAWIRLGWEMTHIDELIGKGKNQLTMDQLEITAVAPYAAADAVAVFRLQPILEKEIRAKNALNLLMDLEMPLIQILLDMEETGILLDSSFFNTLSRELNGRLVALEDQVFQAAGQRFNLNSTQQLSKILFDTLKLTPPEGSRKTTSGLLSTSADILDLMRGDHPVVDWILEYRELAKLKSTYVDALPLQVNPNTGRVHTSYNQTGTVTGRIGSSDPNLQNIPTRTEQGRKVRQGFIAAPGKVLLSVDYSQIELRIVAHMANDEAMINAFNQGQDIHAATAAAIYRVPLGEVTKDQRRHAKAINFGLIYGMSAYGLSRSTDLTPQEADVFVKEYFTQFPGVKSFLDQLRKDAARIGYVETLFGRRRYFPGLATQTNFNIRSREEREAINAPVQGTAADIIKRAMLQIPRALSDAGLTGKLLLQVHDELVLECPENELKPTAHIVRQEMERTVVLKVPLTTEARSGHNWGEMQVL